MSIEDQIPKLPTPEETSLATYRALGREFGLQHIVGFCITIGIALVGWIILSASWVISRDGEKSKDDAVRDVKITSIQTDMASLKSDYAGVKSDVSTLKGDVHDQSKDISDMKSYMKDMRDQVQSWRIKGN